MHLMDPVPKRNKLWSHGETWRKQALKCVLLSERSQSEKAVYCMVSSLWHPGKGKTMVTDQKKSVTGRGRGGVGRQSTENFTGSETFIWYYNVGYQRLNIAQMHRPWNQRVNPDVNSGLWLIQMCQCWFITGNNCSALELVVLGEAECLEWVEGNSIFFFIIAVNLKLL